MKRRLVAATLAVLLIAGCSGPTGSSGGSTASANVLTTAIGFDIDTLDPAAQVTTNVMQLLKMDVETFTAMKPDGSIAPSLATEWSTAPDGLSWTFTLREGVKFQDGEPFDATAAKFNFDRVISPKTFKAAPNVLTVISGVEVVDATHLKINLKKPFGPLPAALSFPVSGMISPKSATVAPNTVEQIKEPVGTGPYKLANYTKGQDVTFERNATYWGEKPAYAKQVFKIVPEASAREALLKSGGADVLAAPPASSLPALEQGNTKVIWADTSYVIQLVFNTQSASQPLLKKPDVRRALNYAVDRSAIIKSVLFGAGKEINGPLPGNVFGSCPMPKPYNYNPDEAKKLLSAAGAAGMKLSVVSPNGRYVQDYKVAEAVVGQLRAVGLDVSLANPTDWPTYLSQLYVPLDKAKNEASLLGWGTLYGDASQSLLQMRNDYLPPNGLNATYWDNAEYTALVNKGNEATDQNERKQAYCDAQKIAWDAAPVIWLYQLRNPVVTTDKVTNVNGLPNLMFETTWARPA
ncbi:ABC transporter substrate-binding protein [Micromonospora sp. NPDC047740]|uniref:ABC transporter substrate-binding protein n=1 Tax=Micromonospora sp. NPDC047740 TaxID=3364254 RepID=UPI00370FA57A